MRNIYSYHNNSHIIPPYNALYFSSMPKCKDYYEVASFHLCMHLNAELVYPQRLSEELVFIGTCYLGIRVVFTTTVNMAINDFLMVFTFAFRRVINIP